MKLIKTLLFSFFIIGICPSSNAQFWNKIKNKVKQKVENKIEKEADKKIDSILNGKKKTKPKEVKKDSYESFGSASINHSILYGTTSINSLTKTKVNKQGKEVKIIGYWDTFGVDVHDGYIIMLKNVDDINNLQNKTFKIPEEASVRLDYDALVKGQYNFNQKVRAGQQEVEFTSGSVTITFNKDKNIILSFSGNSLINNHKNPNKDVNTLKGNIPVTLTGMINTTSPEYTITRERKEKQKNNVDAISNDKKIEMFKKMSPTINIPSTFSFDKRIEVKMTDHRGDAQTIDFLTGNYPDIYGMSVATKEMKGQEMLIVNTPKSTTMFMNMPGMKIKKTMSLEQMGNQYNMSDKLPEDGDFSYKKTGNTKTIIGYLCEEVKVEYEYTNQKGSTSFWLSKNFPIQNKAIPMLGMKMNNPNFSGFVLEMNTIQNGKKFTIEVVNISNKKVEINTNEYKKMGF
jgi:hypothetical protein